MSEAPVPRARVQRVAPPASLLDALPPGGVLLAGPGGGIVAHGAARTIAVAAQEGQGERAAAAAAEALAALKVEGDGPDPVAVGVLPFDGAAESARLVIPRWALRVEGREAWIISVGSEGEPESLAIPPTGRWDGGRPAVLRVRPEPPPEQYEAAVAAALRRIASGEADKIVLARSLLAEAAGRLDPGMVLRQLVEADPDSYAFAWGDLVGVSPELLVSLRGDEVVSRPLAGTARRFADLEADRDAAAGLLASAKDRREHDLVVDAARETLARCVDDLTVDPDPALLATSRVWHLATSVRGRLRDPSLTALHLAGRLHPTPAVCGTPTAVALAAIRRLEPVPRGLYAGALGWVDRGGDGEWVVVLRSARLDGRRARLFAGAGIVAGSDPARERAETDAKFAVMLSALRAVGTPGSS